MNTSVGYPIRVQARLEQPSRWLWLVKWFLAIPHYIVLAFLWMAFAVLSVAAFFAILFTGRYPRSIFEFNAGVLRWTWRVTYYAYGALATDRYPPFTLRDVPDYPARLEIAYPERLSRGLVLVKWWLLAIPHYLIVAVFAGGAWFAGRQAWFGNAGLISILVLVAAVVLLFTGRYPRALFDFILGLNRWVLRVALYAGLMTDEYPPFHLDTGGDEPGTLAVQTAEPGATTSALRSGWTGGRITSVVIGSVIALTSLGFFAAGGVGLYAHTALRDAAGYVTSSPESFSTSTYAVTSDRMRLDIGGAEVAGSLLGDVRLRVTPTSGGRPAFVGIGPTADAEAYLGGVAHVVVSDLRRATAQQTVGGTNAPAAPATQTFWVASATGTGTVTLDWKAQTGTWTLVAMNADGTPSVAVSADVGAKFPILPWVAGGLVAAGVVAVVIAVFMIAIPIGRAGRERSVS